MRLKISLVSYINTRPFIDGIESEFSEDEVSLRLLAPSACATDLLSGNCDIALIPVGSLPDFHRLRLLPDYCIGAKGPVESVFLFSQKPVETLHTIILDRHSRTSNALLRILLQLHWKRNVEIVHPEKAHFDQIYGHTGGVVIGDQAIRIRDQYQYAYDLSAYWTQLTGLPFAFAVWAYHPDKINAEQIRRLKTALGRGVERREKSAEKWAAEYNIPLNFARVYLTKHIDFCFDAGKHKALNLFLSKLQSLPDPVPFSLR